MEYDFRKAERMNKTIFFFFNKIKYLFYPQLKIDSKKIRKIYDEYNSTLTYMDIILDCNNINEEKIVSVLKCT